MMKKKKLSFAKKFLKWTVEQWENCLFTDWSIFCTSRNTGQRVRRKTEEGRFVFFQDRATPHTAARSMEYLRTHGLETVFFLNSSPDLNPIEHWFTFSNLYFIKAMLIIVSCTWLVQSISLIWNYFHLSWGIIIDLIIFLGIKLPYIFGIIIFMVAGV